eukprot:gene37371-45380_t
MQGHISAQRLNRDVLELFSGSFDCTASHLTVLQTADCLNELGSISLEVRVFEGPYQGGCFSFCFHIPTNYPFSPVSIWAVNPIWHPNIDLRTGKVALPLEWSPVLTLKTCAIAVQMLMLEPSPDNPLNLEAYSSFIRSSDEFLDHVQGSIYDGGVRGGVHFIPCAMTWSEMHDIATPKIATKRTRDCVQNTEDSRVSTPDGGMHTTPYKQSNSVHTTPFVTTPQPPPTPAPSPPRPYKRARVYTSDMEVEEESAVCKYIEQTTLMDKS